MNRIDRIRRILFLRKGIRSFKSELNFAELQRKPLLFITIAFNNEETLKLQLRLMNSFVREDYHHLIIDNASSSNKAELIRDLALSEKRSWLRLEHQFIFSPSHLHALAIDWTLRNVVKPNRIPYFGLLDHDIYPIREHRILPLLEEHQVYGHFQERGNVWYLWPGFAFFKTDILPNQVSFQPGAVNGLNVDTGGLLYTDVFSKLKKDKIPFCKHSYESINEGEVAQKDKVEILDNWLHSFNGSYWMKADRKEDKLTELLNKIEKGMWK